MQRFVDSSDGTRIAVYEQGDRQLPTIVMAHGWPDSHVLWNGVTGDSGTASTSCGTTTAGPAPPRCPKRSGPTGWIVSPTICPR